MIHEAGALAVQQILHAGRYGGIDHDQCIQPSDVPQTLRHFRPPRTMTIRDIERCIDDHAQALVASLAGVVVHAAGQRAINVADRPLNSNTVVAAWVLRSGDG